MQANRWNPLRPATAFEFANPARRGSEPPFISSLVSALSRHLIGQASFGLALAFVASVLWFTGLQPVRAASSRQAPSVSQTAVFLIKAHQTAKVLHVIVQVRRGSLAEPLDKITAASLFPGKVRMVAPAGGFVALDVTPEQALTLARNPHVRHISSDYGVATNGLLGGLLGDVLGGSTGLLSQLVGGLLAGDDSSTSTSISYETQRSYADVAWQQGLMGDGVGVAIVDSGIAPHPDLAGRIVAWQDFVNGESTPYDDYGHGTHVAGIVAGDGAASANYSSHFVGIAPHVNLIGVKVLDENGMGTTSGVIQGIDWCIQNAKQYNIRVINLSLGHAVYESYATDPLCQEVEAAWNAGIVVVVAAGNYGRLSNNQSLLANNSGYGTNYGSICSPGNDPDVITVGAMKLGSNPNDRSEDYIASYSSRGPTMGDDILKPDIIAFGNLTVSCYDPAGTLDQTYTGNVVAPSQYGGSGSPEYFILSGTSMSTPAVSGAAALMLENSPNISPDTVKLRMMLSADKWGTDPFTYGAGYLDIPAALSCQATSTGLMTSPTVTQLSNGLVGIVTPTGSDEAIWGNSALWGGRVMSNNTIMDSSTVDGQSALWGGRAAYGSSTTWGSSALWGKSVTSGDGGSQGQQVLSLGDLLDSILDLL